MAAHAPSSAFSTQESLEHGMTVIDNFIVIGGIRRFNLMMTDINNMKYYLNEFAKNENEKRVLIDLITAWFHRLAPKDFR